MKRTGPAIIRRVTPASIPVQEPKPTPQRGYPVQDDGAFGEFGKSTRIANLGETLHAMYPLRGERTEVVVTEPGFVDPEGLRLHG